MRPSLVRRLVRLEKALTASPAARTKRSHPPWYNEAAFAKLVHAAEPGTTVAAVARSMGVRLNDDRSAVEADLRLLLWALAGAPPALVPLGSHCLSGSYARVPSRRLLDLVGGASGVVTVPVQAARSTGRSAGFAASVCQPSTLRMVIWPEASSAQKTQGHVRG